MKTFYFILFVLVCRQLNAQNQLGAPAPATGTAYHSEFEWLSATKVKFTFFTRRICSEVQIFTLNKFPDTARMQLFVNNTIVARNILAFRDSIYAHPYNKCLKIVDCFNNGSSTPLPGIDFGFSLFRYSGVLDFNRSDIKDTLNKLNACEVEIGFMGRYAHNEYGSNFEMSTPTKTIYAYLQINRCFAWKPGDRSPVVRQFQPISWYSLFKRGIEQIDLGYLKRDADDSLVHTLSMPRKYPDGQFYTMNSPLSVAYYFPSYCPSGAPCTANPNTNPPRGFYVSPKTGIAKYYKVRENTLNYNPIFTVECKVYKTDSSGKRVKAAALIRQNLQPTSSYFLYLHDTTLNRMAFTQGLAYTYNVCEGARDSIGFKLRDTLASSQSIPDTLEYKFINDVPASRLWVKDTLAREPEINLVWTAPENGFHNNPYTLNLYAHEKLCNPNRAYLFRSAEFNVIPRPRFSIKADTTLCGKLHYKALNLLGSGTYKYRWYVYSNKDTIKTGLQAADSVVLPYPGKWYLSLQVENAQFGCKASFLDSVTTFNAGLTGGIDNTTPAVCKGARHAFKVRVKNASGKLTSAWFSNGSLASGDSLLYATKVQDTLRIQLVLTDQRGCRISDSTIISPYAAVPVQPLPDTAFCYGSGMVVSAFSGKGIDSIVWLHNNSLNAQQQLSKAGIYTIRYTDTNACRMYDTFTLQAVPAILPYTFGDFKLCPGDSLRPLFSSGSGIVYDSVHWKYSGLVLSRLYNPVLKIPGSGSVVLQAWGKGLGLQCTQSDTFEVELHTDTASLRITTHDTCLAYNRTSALLSGASNCILHWGDGAADTFTSTVEHIYTAAGPYQIKAYTKSPNNCPDTFNASVSIHPSPLAGASLNDSAQCLQGNVFTLSTGSLPSAVEHSIHWGDGRISPLSGNGTLEHQYDSVPNTAITRTITAIARLQGCSDTAYLTAELYAHPQAGIATEGLCYGDSTFIEAVRLNTIPVNTYNWFIDGSPEGQLQRFAKLFTGTLSYTLKLEVVSDRGCRGESTKPLVLTEKPIADFNYTSLGSKDGGQLYYFVNRSEGSNAWLWTFDKGDTAMRKSPEYLFTDTGFKRVVLIASAANICFDTAVQWVPVYNKLEFYFPNVFSPNGNGINESFGLSPGQWFMVKEYNLKVYNRWGEMLFNSDHHRQHWTGHNAQQGVYIYKAEIRDIYNILHEYKGVVEVLR